MKRLSPFIQEQLCEAIATLVDDEAASLCLSNFAHCLFVLDLYKNEIPCALREELHEIINDYVEKGDDGQIAFRSNEFSDEQKMELAEQLLAIYIDVKGGSLIY